MAVMHGTLGNLSVRPRTIGQRLHELFEEERHAVKNFGVARRGQLSEGHLGPAAPDDFLAVGDDEVLEHVQDSGGRQDRNRGVRCDPAQTPSYWGCEI
jgi:hypothetical protein